MHTSEHPVLRDVVLVGGGHSHVGVLRHFGMQPEAGVRITLVCNDAITPYSGMLPGYVAGHYRHDEVHIDLMRLCAWAGARFVRAQAIGLDRAKRRVLLEDRPPLPYDLVSLNIGSAPQLKLAGDAGAGAEEAAGVEVGDKSGTAQGVPVKPIHQFNQRWLQLLERVRQQTGPVRIAVVGAGAGGVELLLAMQWRLKQERQAMGLDATSLHFHLIGAQADILPTHNARVRRRFEQVLKARSITVHTGAAVDAAEAGRLRVAGQWLAVDETVWVTQAIGAAWLESTGLPLDERGFVEVRSTLQSVGDERVFAAGDVASLRGLALQKAGVFAVRMARPLAQNLRRALQGERLRHYRPQRSWLALISTGDRYAVASRGAWSAAGGWLWHYKDWIDRRFMARYADLTLTAMPSRAGRMPAAAHAQDVGALQVGAVRVDAQESAQALAAQAMRCGGCGAKVGAGVLSAALAGLQPVAQSGVQIGMAQPDDAAVLMLPPGKALVQSVDFFRAFIDDAYVFGRIAANHALGDLYAMGAAPHSALALAVLPPGLSGKVQDELHQLMAGAVDVLNAAGCSLLGGHSGEGRELALGFTVNGLVDASMQGVLRKSGLQPGDALVLCKPLGTGVLMAAQARLLARGPWVAQALELMQQSSALAARCLQRAGVTACTDVTGFGLLGHLLEMTRASAVRAELFADAVPLLDGALHCAAQGVRSSMQEANEHACEAWMQHLLPLAAAVDASRWALLFDPQTAGGLLAGVPAHRAQATVDELRTLGYAHAAVIGRVLESAPTS